jgi:hypothetical protein
MAARFPFAPSCRCPLLVCAFVRLRHRLGCGFQLRCRFRVVPLEQWNVRREFLRRLKHAFDERRIEIPFPHVTVYAGSDKAGSATPFQMLVRQRKATVDVGEKNESTGRTTTSGTVRISVRCGTL